MDVLQLIKNEFGKEINDEEIKAEKTWSSEKINTEIGNINKNVEEIKNEFSENKNEIINDLNSIVDII